MDGLILRYFLIELIRVFNRAVFYAGRTARAFVLFNVPGLPDQGYLEVSCFSFYTVNFRIGQDLYIGMPADLDQFGREYSHGAVIGGIGLVKLCHMAADGRSFLNQIDLITRSGKVKRGLNTTDPPTEDHNIPKIPVCGNSKKLSFNRFLFHFLSPHQVFCVRNAQVGRVSRTYSI
jgi:hypothetical protein